MARKSPPAEPAIASAERIEDAVAAIRAAAHEHLLSMVIRTGQIVVDLVFDGDLGACQAEGPRSTSLRLLSERLADEGIDLSPPGLHRAAGVYALDQHLSISALKQITATHCYAVLPLPADEQERLLKLADEEGWTTRQLEAAARAIEAPRPERRGRPPLPRFEKSVNQLARLLADPDEAFGDLDDEHLEKLNAERVGDLDGTAARMIAQLTALREKLQARLAAAGG